jgi:translation initiation factor IF-2
MIDIESATGNFDNDWQPGVGIPDPIVVRDLASILGKKPFQVIADLMELGEFVHANTTISFATASKVAKKHGFQLRKI